jgi:predicted DNA-binding transcriptional regulator YafY
VSVQRQLSCLLLLQNERKQTAAQLAAQLEVSVRTVYRDVETLSGAGVPISMERGAHGGIVLADDYRRALATFSSDDIAALFSASASPMRDLGMPDATDVLRKLAGALNERQRKAAADARSTLLVDHARWYRLDQPTDVLAQLRAAIEHTAMLDVRYRDRAGAFTRRRIAPLGLVSKTGAWYLVAREAEKGDRTFRVDRLDEIVSTGERFTRPAGFDLSAHWAASIASLERTTEAHYEFVLRLRPHVVDRMVRFWNGSVVAGTPAYVDVRFRFHNGDDGASTIAASLIVALGDDAEILSPPALRAQVIDRARAAIAHHASPPRS